MLKQYVPREVVVILDDDIINISDGEPILVEDDTDDDTDDDSDINASEEESCTDSDEDDDEPVFVKVVVNIEDSPDVNHDEEGINKPDIRKYLANHVGPLTSPSAVRGYLNEPGASFQALLATEQADPYGIDWDLTAYHELSERSRLQGHNGYQLLLKIMHERPAPKQRSQLDYDEEMGIWGRPSTSQQRKFDMRFLRKVRVLGVTRQRLEMMLAIALDASPSLLTLFKLTALNKPITMEHLGKFQNACDVSGPGIYVIEIEGPFYVGMSKMVGKRVLSHDYQPMNRICQEWLRDHPHAKKTKKVLLSLPAMIDRRIVFALETLLIIGLGSSLRGRGLNINLTDSGTDKWATSKNISDLSTKPKAMRELSSKMKARRLEEEYLKATKFGGSSRFA